MKQWWLTQRWYLLGLTVGYVLTTVPFVSRTPFNWDAAQFVLGVQHFSVHMHQPHPPGYPLFIGLGKFLAVFSTPNTALVIVSALFGLISVLWLYQLALEVWSDRRWLAALIAASWILNPLFWLYREVALTYTVDAAAAIIVAWCVWRTLQQRAHQYVVASTSVIALAAGFRPSLVVLLLPLWLVQVWYHKRNWRFLLMNIGLGTAIGLAWLVPLIILSGGLQQYRIDSAKLYSAVSAKTALFTAPGSAVIQQIQLVFTTLLEAWNSMIILLLFTTIVAGLAIWQNGWQNYRVQSLRYGAWVLAWLLPPLLIYSFVHLGQLGYLLMVLPLGYLAIGPGLLWLRQWVRPWGLVLVAVVLAHSLVFLWLRPAYAHPEFIPRTDREATMQQLARIMPNGFRMNRHVIAEQDAKHAAYTQLLSAYDPATTVIITGRNVQYTSLYNGLNILNDNVFRELSALFPDFFIVEVGRDRDYYLTAQHASMTTTYSQVITVPTATRQVIMALHQLPVGTEPQGLLLERQRIPDSAVMYYHGVMNQSWHWLGYTFQYPAAATPLLPANP